MFGTPACPAAPEATSDDRNQGHAAYYAISAGIFEQVFIVPRARSWENWPMPTDSRIPGFHRLTPPQRRDLVFGEGADAGLGDLFATGGWDPDASDRWSEDVLGPMALPFSVAPNFVINGTPQWVPMVTEEPSVVAAAAHGAKLAAEHGGFLADAGDAIATAQLQLQVADPGAAWTLIEARATELIAHLAPLDPALVAHGGGPLQLERGTVFEDELIVHLHLRTADAMGANIANTFAEALAPHLERLTGGEVIGRILTNAFPRRLTRVRADFSVETLAHGGFTGAQIADRMLRLVRWAGRDPLRAVTHDKGILNGVLAVTQATANDTRAVAMAAAAHACGPGGLRPLSRFFLSEDGTILTGELAMPLPLGTVGGLTVAHPLVRRMLLVLGLTRADRLCETAAACGLANHVAALRALAGEGIQAGHMALHRRK
jgi:hydroxymethylglutaryl-CoA reductase